VEGFIHSSLECSERGGETMARKGLQLRDDIKFFGEIFSVDKRTMEKVIQGLYSHHP